MNPTSCPSAETLARWRSSPPGEVEAEGIEAHLADCSRCRRLVLEAHLDSVSAPLGAPPPAVLARVRALSRRRRSVPARPAWLALAAALLVALGVGLWVGPAELQEVAAPVERAGVARTLGLTLLAPPDDAPAEAAIRFHWSAVQGARAYRLTLLDARGDRLAVVRSTATEVTIDLARLAPPAGEPLFWAVRAELEDGGVVDSQPARLAPLAP